jgi:hypothetical protein
MRTVLKNNAEVAHVWAQQTQSEGRGSNFYFEGPRLWSYGHHFLAAQIHTVKGKRFVVINSRRYYAASATRGLMPTFYGPNPGDLKATVAYTDGLIAEAVASALRRRKVTDRESIAWEIQSIRNRVKEANALRRLLGRKTLKDPTANIAEVSKHLHRRLARYQELNTPERRAEKRARERAEQARREAALAERIQDFRSGIRDGLSLSGLPYDLLRISADGTEVQTSRGARVPLREAQIAFLALEGGRDIRGMKVGHYTINGLTSLQDGEGIVTIGCHRVLLSEARSVLAPHADTCRCPTCAPRLRLVTEGNA